jgi:hypothetical protein
MLSRRLDGKMEVAACLLRLAEVEQSMEGPARAVRLYWAARSVYDSIGVRYTGDNPNLEKRLASCHAALGEAEFTVAVEEGRAMTREQALAYALEDGE